MTTPLAKKIKEIRKQNNLTQWELSQKIKMSDAYVAYVETGRRSLCLKTAFKLEKALKLRAGEISNEIIRKIEEAASSELAGMKF